MENITNGFVFTVLFCEDSQNGKLSTIDNKNDSPANIIC